MGPKASKSAAKINVKRHALNATHHSSFIKQHARNKIQQEAISPSRTLDDDWTPPVSPRSRNVSRLGTLVEKEVKAKKRPDDVAKIDVRALNKIKRHPRIKFNGKTAEPTPTSSPQLNASTQPNTNRSELVPLEFALEPIQVTDPYDRFRIERFEHHKPLSARPEPRTARLSLIRPKAASTDVSRTQKEPQAIPYFTELIASCKILQSKKADPSPVKDTLLVHRKTEDVPASRRHVHIEAPPEKHDLRYRILHIRQHSSLTKTDNSVSSLESASQWQSKAEKQWLWKGSYGALRTSK
mmetsp:Transcript_7181/g.13173  ORF Transcript_7181/g.13173 Transcript_7181/m.13173 type:complete len:297 (-) Transcript_7181:15-905(-)